MRNNKLLKTWFLCCLSMMAVNLRAQLRPDTPADYGCASIGTVYWDEYAESGEKLVVKGWMLTDDGMFMSDEFDLSQIQNPTVIATTRSGEPVRLEKLWVSEDGVTFAEYTAMKSGLNPIPKTAKRVKVQVENPYAVQFLLVGEMWNRESKKNFIEKLDYQLVTGRDSLDSYNRHIYKSVPVNGDDRHHQMEFTAKVNPVVFEGESQESFLDHAVVDVRLPLFSARLYYDSDGWREYEEMENDGDVTVSVTYLCNGEMVQSRTLPITKVRTEEMYDNENFSLPVLVPRNATDINLKLEWTTEWIKEYDNLDWAFEYVYVNTYEYPQMCIKVSECHEFEDETSFLNLSTIRDYWYDYDGDGIKEWCPYRSGYSNEEAVYKFKADMLAQYPVIQGLKSFDGWINYGHDERTDAYSTQYIYKIEANTAQKVQETPWEYPEYVKLRPLDFNNDGTPDFWKGKQYDATTTKGEALTLGPDGTFVSEIIPLMTAEEYYDIVKESGGGHDLGFGFGSVSGSSKPTPGANGSSFAQTDLNNDGYPDFIDYPSGYYLLNTGDGRFVIDTFGGTVAMRDFDNDGICDMFIYDTEDKQLTVYLQCKDEEPVMQKLFSGLFCSQVWIRDFDKDGDLDILAAFNAVDNNYNNPNSETYLLVFENNGKGAFKYHENYIEGKISFAACTDYDADGEYEVIGWTESEEGHYDSKLGWLYDYSVWSCSMSGININTKCELIDVYPNLGSDIMPANVDNSGLTRLVFPQKMLTPSEAKNSRPTRPSAPKVSYDASTGEVYVAWERGHDKETARLDLTYELRIGTAPDKGDIVYAYAMADGSRRNMLEGNCGFQTFRRFNASGWPEGTIYVSVQAIDDGKMGSEFSEYTTFEKKEPAGSFRVQHVESATVGDEFELVLDRPKVAGSTYSWNLGDGAIKSEKENSWVVTFPTAGKKELALSVVSASGNRSTTTRTISVAGMRAERVEEFGWNGISATLDMDLDGKTEVLSGKFFEGDETGNYTTVKRMFNNQLEWNRSNDCYVVDRNMDGLPDLIGYYWLMNRGDKSMEILESQYYDTHKLTADFDNDGFPDNITDCVIRRNGGDYKTFTEVTAIPGARWTADFNGDGLVDLLCNNNEVLLNKGNFNFEKDETVPAKGLPDDENDYGFCFDDFDGNGNLDIAWTSAYPVFQGFVYSDTLTVRWSDGSSVKIPAPSGYRFGFVKENSLDFDNNGCKDLYVNTDQNVGFIVYFNSDRSYRIEKDVMLFGSNLMAYRRTDGLLGVDCFKVYGSGNEAPTAPSQLRASQNSKFVSVEWNPGTDTETPSAALRYNISIKHKGAEGDGAYFMSPLNGGVNGVAVPSGKQLLTGTKISIPVESIPAGEYEVKVQAVDAQWLQSDFSETLTFTVSASGAFDLPSATMVGKIETVRLFAGVNPADIDFGEGAEIVSSKAQSVEVRWLTEGTKTVTCGEFSSSIHVYPALNAAFSVPDEVFVGTKLRIHCDNTHNSKWELVKFKYYDNPNFFDVVPVPQDDIYQLKTIDANTVEFTFAGKPWDMNFALRHTVSAEYGSDMYEVKLNYVPMAATPEIDLVDINENNHYRLSWEVPSEIASKVTGVNVFRETSTYGRFEQIATLAADASMFADEQSMPAIKSERYAISYMLTYGETQMTRPHQPMHLMVNRGAGNGWNLCWNRYEGRDIASYRILRGTAPESLQYITEVAGSNTSYSDLAAPEGTCYYAVEILADAPDATLARNRVAAKSRSSRSNIVSTDDAGSLTPATSIAISSASGDFVIDGKQVNALQLMATVYPMEATIRKVDWAVVDGADVVSVNSRGLVSALNDGMAIVRATATDGSGVYEEVSIIVNNLTGIEDVSNDNSAPRSYDIYTLQGILVKRDAKEADIRRLVPGLYIIGGRKVMVK